MEEDRCEFYPKVRCLRDGKRTVKCVGCSYLEKFEREMEAEELEFFDMADAMRSHAKKT